jgi:outer membrane protein with beta-barrel domain
VLVVIVGAALPAALAAQQPPSRPDSTPRLGLGASSAINFHAGVGQVKHATLGVEAGGALDIGSIGARRVRLSVGVDYLAMSIDRPDSLGVRERGDGYVFTAFADVNVIPSLTRRLTPYGGAGFGVDAVGTTISNEQVGALYNTNVFDLHGQVGVLYRVTPNGRLSLEARGTGARVVRRVGVRLGYTLFYNQLR